MRAPQSEYEIDIVATPDDVEATNALATFQLKPRYRPRVHDAHTLARISRNQGRVQSALQANNLALKARTTLDSCWRATNSRKLWKGIDAVRILCF
jgi:hypothetical protein